MSDVPDVRLCWMPFCQHAAVSTMTLTDHAGRTSTVQACASHAGQVRLANWTDGDPLPVWVRNEVEAMMQRPFEQHVAHVIDGWERTVGDAIKQAERSDVSPVQQ